VPALFADAPVLYTYPTPAALAAAGEEALRACGLGYRAAFLHRTAAAVARGEVDLAALSSLSDHDARAALMRCHGVGAKIANCVLLFACERLAAFPIDVWIERVLHQFYFAKKRNVTTARIEKFANTHFGPYAGYAQQFLFHLARMTKLRD
jgi:N-glycosylase/DNA lyase